MVLNSSEIKEKLRSIWNIRDIWLLDRKYFILDIEVVAQIITGLSNKKIKFTSEVWDCDNYALMLHSEVQKFQFDCMQCSKPSKQFFPWAFGECLGTKFKDRKVNHATNIAVCNEGVFLIEPQSDNVWEAVKEKDDLYFIKF